MQNLYRFVWNDPVLYLDVLGLRGNAGGARQNCLDKGDPWKWVSNGTSPEPNGCTGVSSRYKSADFSEACNNHDICYSTCEKTKSECDDEFRSELYTACDMAADKLKDYNRTNREGFRKGCKARADTYRWGVGQLGAFFYHKAQNRHCECKCCEEEGGE